MPLIFKPVAATGDKKYQIKKDTVGDIKLEDILCIFEIFGLTKEDLPNVKFVANSETIKNNDKVYKIDENETLNIFVFSPVKEIREKLENIFIKHNTNLEIEKKINKPNIDVDTFIQQNIDTPEEDVTPTLDDETVKRINENSVKLFQDEDFKNLVRIYYSNQDIMKTFLNFIVHGDIVKLNIPTNDLNKSYENEIMMLQSLGIKESNEEIIKYLNMFNGHVNLTLRALLCKSQAS